MKDREDFIKTLKGKVACILGEGAIVRETTIPVNNDRPADALEIRRRGNRAGVRISIEPYYRLFGTERGVDWIAEDLCREYKKHVNDVPMLTDPVLADCIASSLNDFGIVRDRIVFRLVSAAMNKERLKGVPHVRVLDLAMEFGISLGTSREGSAWSGIPYNKMRAWGVGAGSLLKAALRNTPSIFPLSMNEMGSLLWEMEAKQGMEAEQVLKQMKAITLGMERPPVYILSSSTGGYGAGAFLYPNVLRSLAESIGGNLVILPSSIYETILMPADEETDMETMKNMVVSVNRTEVARSDWLADNAYLYDRTHDCLRAAGKDAADETDVFYLSELEDIAGGEIYDEAAV